MTTKKINNRKEKVEKKATDKREIGGVREIKIKWLEDARKEYAEKKANNK
jgi:hypothetical protein